jgi:23S rRNA pseudouridine1911/1915/1917 synthase
MSETTSIIKLIDQLIIGADNMEIKWQVQAGQQRSFKQFLLGQGISQRLYTKIKALQLPLYLNQKKVTPDSVVQVGDWVSLQLPAEPADESVIISHGPLSVIYEDEYWLVVDKPAGLSTIPGPTNQTDTLLNRIKGYWQQQGAQNLVPHIITRLDYDTSGVVLVGKHQVAQSLLQPQIEKHQLQKLYLAVVAGNGLAAQGEINAPIGRVATEIRRQVLATGQSARTSYWLLGESNDRAAVKVQIHTGRTHQIRVHFSDLGHPLLGDQLYGGPLDLGIERQALHAYQLCFLDPFTQQTKCFNAPIPEEIQTVLPATVQLADLVN